MPILMRSNVRAKPKIITKSTSVSYSYAALKLYRSINKQGMHVNAQLALNGIVSVSE